MGCNCCNDELSQEVIDSILDFKRVRLTETKMSYEDLAVQDNFSDDEFTFDLH